MFSEFKEETHGIHLKTGGWLSEKYLLALKYLVVTLQNSCLYQISIDWWVKVKNYHSILFCQYSGYVGLTFYLALLLISVGCAMVEAVSHCPLTIEAQVWSQASPGGICGRQSSIGIGFPLITLVFFCHYYSAIAPCSYFIHLHLTLHNCITWQCN